MNFLPDGTYQYEYDVDMWWATAKDDRGNPIERWIRVHRLPYEGIQIYDKAFSTDWHLHNVFRHNIMIPDDMMPEAWKNKDSQ